MDPRRTVRVLLLIGCLAGLSTYLVSPIEQSEQLMLASDVYRHATSTWLAGGDVYGTYHPDRPGYGFLYPPLAVLVFLPHALVGSAVAAYVMQTVLNLGAALGTALVVHRGLTRRGVAVNRRDLVLLGGFMVLSSYSAIQFLNGQINLWLAFAIALGFEALDRNRSTAAGVLFASAALLKVFPAVIGVWLLRRRAYRAVAAAVATGVGGILLGAILLGPDLTMTYLGDVLIGRFEGSTYDGVPSPTDNVDGIHRQLAALRPGSGFHTLIALAVLGPLAAITQLDVASTVTRDVAGLGILVSILLLLPLQPLYFPLLVFPLLMVLHTCPAGIERWLLVAGTACTLLHLDQESIVLGLAVMPIPDGIASWVAARTAAAFTFVLPPTVGLWLILIACVLIQLPDVDGDVDRSTTTAA